MSGIRGNSARILLMSSAASFALNGVAVAETLSFEGDDPFASLETMSVDELMDARGGYSAGGFKFNIGVNVAPVTVTPVAPTKVTPVAPTKVTPVSVTPVAPTKVTPVDPVKVTPVTPVTVTPVTVTPTTATNNTPSASSPPAIVETTTSSSAAPLPSAPETVVTPTSDTPTVETPVASAAPTVETPAPAASTPVSEPPPATIVTQETAPTTPAMETTPTVSTPAGSTPSPQPAIFEAPVETGGTVTIETPQPTTNVSNTQGEQPQQMTSFLNLDLKDFTGTVRNNASGRSKVDDNSSPSSPRPPQGVTVGDPASTIKPAGDTVIQQEGYSVSVDNSRDYVQVNLTTEYTVRFENYRQGIEMAIGTRVTQTALGTQSLLGGLSN